MFWKNHLSRRVTSSFLILALLTVTLVAVVAFLRAREALKKAAYDRLNVTATLKEQEITRWLESCEQDFLIVTRFPDVDRLLQELLTQPSTSAESAAAGALRTYLQEIRQLKPKFSEIFILDRSNHIVLSTDLSQEGQYEIATNLTYFETVIEGKDFTPVFYVSPIDGTPAVTYAAPIRDRNGQRQGVILAHLNLQRIDQIVRERTGLGETGETYLVGSLAEKTAFISRQPQLTTLPEEPHSFGIDQAMQAVSGQSLYKNYAEVPVIGVYRWLSDQDLALLVEMAQTEAFKPARQLAVTIGLVGLGSAIALCLGVMQLAKQLSQSRHQLEDYSHCLEKTAQKAQAANQAKSEFLANMSHELRTPLNAILGFTQLIESDRTLKPQHYERVKIISRSGEHLLALINDVLSMSKIEAGRIQLTSKCFDLHELLLSLETMLRIKAEAKGLTLKVHRDCQVPHFIESDEGKLRQVLVNLLGNAVKFTNQGTVTLSITVPDITSQMTQFLLRFTVADTGPGIITEEQQQLFEPFFQATHNQQAPQGTGLGLAISQQFVQLLGGKITVVSELGQGATFSFTIPVKIAETPATTTAPIVTELLPSSRVHRILIVDDDANCRRLLIELLTGVGFTVQEAINGEQALRCWHDWQPHLILMDMRMPIMDGYETTRQIRDRELTRDRQKSMEEESKGGGKHNSKASSHKVSSHRNTAPPTAIQTRTKIIALTASAFDEEQAAILACGCDGFIRKPFQIQQIFDKLTEHLGVTYRYSKPVESEITSTSLTLQPHDLEIMPHIWISHLHQAAIQVDAEQVHILVDQIPEKHGALAKQLINLTQAYDFDTLVDLTEPWL